LLAARADVAETAYGRHETVTKLAAAHFINDYVS